MRRTSRRWKVFIGGACTGVLFLLAAASAALAISAPIHIANTAGEGVFIRLEPNTSQSAIGWMPEGASPDYNCFAWGQSINGVPIWFNVNYNGKTGFYASYYDDSSYHSNDELTAKYGVPLCGQAPPAPAAPPPAPAPAPSSPPASAAPAAATGTGLVFSVFNTEGGVFYRNSPNWSDTPRVTGVGVYDGDRVELICGSMGTSVGSYNNRAWSKVRNLFRPSIGEGWVNEHFINDGAAANTFVAGEPMCAGSSGGQGSLYYSPYPENPHGPNSTGQITIDHLIGKSWTKAPSPATVTMHQNQWDVSRDGQGCPALASFVPRGSAAFDGGQITTLASWSLARAAPFMFLKARPDLQPQIHYILLFDPGTDDEWDSSACVAEYPIGGILRDWLIASPANRLVVLSGVKTADVGHTSVDGHGHAGIQNHLFYPLKRAGEPSGRHLRAQIIVCNYDEMSHENVWINFRSWMNNTPITLGTCPVDPETGKRPIAWNP